MDRGGIKARQEESGRLYLAPSFRILHWHTCSPSDFLQGIASNHSNILSCVSIYPFYPLDHKLLTAQEGRRKKEKQRTARKEKQKRNEEFLPGKEDKKNHNQGTFLQAFSFFLFLIIRTLRFNILSSDLLPPHFSFHFFFFFDTPNRFYWKTASTDILPAMSGLVSDEVAEDYKNSLEDLTTNDKFQISNLTVIAKENTEHAMAISRVLENHIRNVGANFFPISAFPPSLVCCLAYVPCLAG